jgi:hypothetical protein
MGSTTFIDSVACAISGVHRHLNRYHTRCFLLYTPFHHLWRLQLPLSTPYVLLPSLCYFPPPLVSSTISMDILSLVTLSICPRVTSGARHRLNLTP